MRIDWLWIEEYKNLKNLTIDFAQDHLITVLIGRNGTGKSNVLEALTIIFRDLLMAEKKPSFKYMISYEIRDRWVIIDADPDRNDVYRAKAIAKQDQESPYPVMSEVTAVSGGNISRPKLIGENSGYLPAFLFGYYSGQSYRMREVFLSYLKKYDDSLIADKDPGFKRMFFAEPVHSNFVLLSFLVNEREVTDKLLQEQLGLEEGGIESVLFVLKQPYWYSKNRSGGDSRFWNSKGIVREFLVKLYSVSLAPIRISRRETYDVRRTREREYLYLFAKDVGALRDLAQGKSAAEFFRDLESTHVSDLIEEVRIRVKLKKNDGSVTFRELSEGEQQLLTVLGLLQFTTSSESLFLLDEPDTHLNPRWSVEYIQHIRSFLGGEKGDNQSSHVLLATHNPVAVAELEKEQVQILKRDNVTQEISAFAPDEDPRGMGYAGVMTSEMFGLSAAVDTYTQSLLEVRRQLSSKENLEPDEEFKLREVVDKLDTLGFRYQFRDPELTKIASEYFSEFESAQIGISGAGAVDAREKAERLVQRALGQASKGTGHEGD
ncbi:AAA family ATPase [Cereibacter sphaeroides]|nr:AAA family ATPase [Cereibacter sphaeroides]